MGKPTFTPDHLTLAEKLIREIAEHYRDTGQPLSDGEAEATAVMLVGFNAGRRCPGASNGIDQMANTFGVAAQQGFLMGFEATHTH